MNQSSHLHRRHASPPIIARLLALFLILALLLAACGGNEDEGADTGADPTKTQAAATPTTDAPASPPAASPTEDAEDTEGAATMPAGDELPPSVQAAVEAAAEDEGVEVDEVELLGFERVEWSDSSLGCPEPGQFYAQVIVPGYIVRVEVNGTTIEYHTDTDRQIVRC